MQQKKAFTIIELIFVIVILGILAAVAVPKLSATRNDAIVSTEVMGASQLLKNLGTQWATKENWTEYSVLDANKIAKCFTFSATSDGNVTVTPLAAPSQKCPSGVLAEVISLASQNGILKSNGDARIYQFGGISVKK
ncbi:MAG: type II secretion system protein [Sulfurimonas sp.]|jgi:prepilin-type N-terminal cleavage/methylation domain-containing protein|nr:type II secretion system protein [Sulfurimonas sp.]